MASADHLVPPVHCTSATLDIFQVLNHSKFFSTLATMHLLFPLLKKRIFLNLHLSGVFSSFRSQQTITSCKRLSLTTLPCIAHHFSWVILYHFPCFIFYIALMTLLIYLSFVISSVCRMIPGKCMCVSVYERVGLTIFIG